MLGISNALKVLCAPILIKSSKVIYQEFVGYYLDKMFLWQLRH